MAFEYNGVVYRDLEPQVRYDAEQIELLKQQKSNATNIENGIGENSLIQKSFEGKENKAYQRNSVALGSNTQAGMTEEEFNEHFKYDRDGNIKDPIVDDSGFAYSQSNGYAFAAGEETKAKDRGSVALGIANESWGAGASAMGDHTKALSNFSHSFGKETVAGVSKYNGECATAFGKGTQATGENSFSGGEGSKATNKHSFAFGLSANSEGFAGTAFGEYTTASGADSLAVGRQSTASGNQSVALGFNSEATSTFSVAIGNNAKATGYGQVAVGNYNNPSVNKALFMVGNGSSDTDTGRKNAFTVLWDGRAKVQSAPVDDDDVVRKCDLTGTGGGGSGGGKLYKHTVKLFHNHDNSYTDTLEYVEYRSNNTQITDYSVISGKYCNIKFTNANTGDVTVGFVQASLAHDTNFGLTGVAGSTNGTVTNIYGMYSFETIHDYVTEV